MSTEFNNECVFKDTDPEVELISLTFEKLPKYRLKADCNIQFLGYQHTDFTRAEQVREEITELSNEQIQKTLEYFLLCGLRVCKMTETYEDCAALRLLVEEQRAHMDEAANIGLNLLQRNIQLEQRLETVEDQLCSSKDTIDQLKHQLHLKDDLLRLLHTEIEEAEEEETTSAATTEQEILGRLDSWLARGGDRGVRPIDGCGDYRYIGAVSSSPGYSLGQVSLRRMESKLHQLEEENMRLRQEQANLNSNTDLLENKEQQLIDDCVRQLLDSTRTVERMSSELSRKTNDYLNQHEEISRLLTTNIDLDNKIHQLLTENDNLFTQLRDQQTKQFTLTKELSELRDRYDECINLLNERQDQIRQLKKKSKRDEIRHQIPGYGSCSPDLQTFAPSLAMEFEDSSRKDSVTSDRSRAMRAMEQARIINSTWIDTDDTSSGFAEDLSCSVLTAEMTESSSSTVGDSSSSTTVAAGGNYLLRKSIQEDCQRRRMFKNSPGAAENDLTRSIIDEQQHMLQDDASSSTVASYCTLEAFRHRQNRCHSIRSLNNNILNSDLSSLFPNSVYKLPDKIQLVKPIEGSQTLRTWQNLATPSITKALFEEQSQSVCFRGQQHLMMSPSPSSPCSEHSNGNNQPSLQASVIFSDYEDDVDCDDPILMSQPLQLSNFPSSSTFTYTNARVMHPFNNDTCSPNAGLISHVVTPASSTLPRDSSSNFSLNLDTVRDVSLVSVTDTQDSTPVNERSTEQLLMDTSTAGVSQPPTSGATATSTTRSAAMISNDRTMPSWLDRLTVKSVMTSILGYPLPHLHRAIANSAAGGAGLGLSAVPVPTGFPSKGAGVASGTKSKTSTSSGTSTSSTGSRQSGSSSLIERLTKLPPLAQRRYPPQLGLNLLSTSCSPASTTSTAGPNDARHGVVHRLDQVVTSAAGTTDAASGGVAAVIRESSSSSSCFEDDSSRSSGSNGSSQID